jgi:hypothetical protein
MKRSIIYIIPLFLLLNACVEEPEVMCYPQRVKTTIASGSGASSVTADYKYSGNLIDRIVWSNSQTHYISYNAEEQVVKYEEFDVKNFVKTEYRVDYSGDQIMRIDKYISKLHYLTQIETDTAYVSYHTFLHDGANVSEELEYQRKDESEEFALRFMKEYTYDASGNISSLVSMDVVTNDTAEAYTFLYDYQKNPYNALELFFNGETFVNNILEKVDLVNDETYSYQVLYNANLYPNQINIKVDGYLYQVITYDYMCK